MKRKYLLYLLCLFLQLLTDSVFAQANTEYHFVYSDISETERENLQIYLGKFYKQIEDQKYVFFLSCQNKPVVATNKESFDKLQASISNISNLNINSLSDLEQINKVISKYDFLNYDNSQPPDKKLKCLYNRVVMHFFLDPGSYNTLNLKKYLIERLLAINYYQKGIRPIDVIVYFDANAFKTIQLKNPETFTTNEYKLVKY